jgi:predicted regulator of Ras-like GTPase activity (Roadblock/LC7/MglB family)
MPSLGVPPNAITTQPMVMSRLPAPATPPATAKRSTQRLVVTPNAAAKMTSTRPLPMPLPSAAINLPAGMILRCLPPEMLSSELAEFEASGAAATEIGLPMNAILSQLPSGKVEFPAQELVALLPPGFLKSAGEIAPLLGSLISLPLMDVVMRIPPDLLSVRPDQKDTNVAAGNLADPFTEDTLRPPSRPPAQANIVDENQVAPAEEFVPQVAPTPSSFIPPPRPTTTAPLLHQTASLSGKPAALRSTAPMPNRILPPDAPTGEVPMPPRPPQLSASQMIGVPRPSMAPPAAQPIPVPVQPFEFKVPTPRATSQIPPIVPSATPAIEQPASLPAKAFEFKIPTAPAAPQISPIDTPVTPPEPVDEPPSVPEPESAAPAAPSRAPAVSGWTPSTPFAPTIPLIKPVVPTVPEVLPPAPGVPDSNADELQRLAALAMAEIGDKPADSKTDSVEETSEPAKVEEPVFEAPATPAPSAIAVETEKPSSLLPPPPAKVEPGFSATSRFGLPESPARDLLAQTTPVVPAPSASATKDTGRLPGRPDLTPRSITTRVTPSAPSSTPEAQPSAPATAINLNNCTAEDLLPIPGISRALAASIVQHRDKIGEFHRLEELLDVPGMTRSAYSNLTGEAPPTGLHPSINELLGFPADKDLSLKEVTDRIACWPDVTGVLLSQKNGLPLVGTAPDFLDRSAIGAFAPRIFEDLNKSFGEITGRQTEELVIPTTGTSFHLMRDKDLYLIILSRVPQMPDRHLKIARMVLAGLSIRPS